MPLLMKVVLLLLLKVVETHAVSLSETQIKWR